MNKPFDDAKKEIKIETRGPAVQFKCRVRSRDLPSQEKVIMLAASSKDDAVQRLITQGFLVVAVEKVTSGGERFSNLFSVQSDAGHGRRSSKSALSFLNSVSTRELIFFGVQLATLIKAGIPLLRSLEIIEKGVSNPFFGEVLGEIRKKIAEGGTFSKALRDYANVFPWIWVNLVEVGEATGKLPECLEEIAHYQESAARIQSKVVTAFFYPGILTVAVLGAVTFLLIFIVPKFSAIFEAQGLPLPVITQIVVGISNVVRHQALLLGIIVAILIGLLIFVQKSPKLRKNYDLFMLSFPIFGGLLLHVAVVRFSKALSTLLRSGVQILKALEISGKLLENKFLEEKVLEVSQAVKAGQGLGAQMESKKVFPVFMTQLVTIGEESGQIEKFLNLIATFYEEGIDDFLARLSAMLEPVLLLFMGGIIGVVVIAMFLPIIELSTKGGGG